MYFFDDQINIVVARPGRGKTTFAAFLAQKFHKLYPDSPVYTNIPDLSGCYLVDFSEVKRYRIWHKNTGHALYLLDEAGTGETNNRNFRNFSPEMLLWISTERHEKVSLWLFSQAVDMDITFTRKALALYTLKRFWRFTWLRRWFVSDGQTDLESGLPKSSWQQNPFPVVLGSIIYRPHYYALFNSWYSPFEHLPDVPESRLIP